MSHPLITAAQLAEALDARRPLRLFDCRARLGDPGAGRALWQEAHLPGAHHFDLDRDLAGAPGQGGRHPLPTREAFTATLRRLGIAPKVPVVVYDDMSGQLAAARAWWMLACWAGHPDVRVLDGGLEAWRAEGGEFAAGEHPLLEASDWAPAYHEERRVEAERLLADSVLKVDARSRERFRGDVEPIDPVAGHIPGAVCRPSVDNLTPGGCFKPPAQLAAELPRAEQIVAYCGSGVTACHTVLAYAVAGLPLPQFYPGSWSEWIRDPARPIATGE